MNDDSFLLPLIDFSIGTSALKEINDIWVRNLPRITREYECLKDNFEKLRDIHRKDSETNKNLTNINTRLNDQLERAAKENNSIMSDILALKEERDDFARKVKETSEERDAAIRKLLNLQAQLEDSHHEKEELSIDLGKAKKELREAIDSIGSLNTQLISDRRTYEQSLEEQEKSSRIRMEDQKNEIERRMRAEFNNKIRKYDVAHNKMKADFEDTLRVAEKEAKSLVLERNEYFAKFTELRNQLEKYKASTHAEMQRLVTEKCHEMVSQLTMRKEPESNKDLLLRTPDFFANRFLKELTNVSSTSSPSPADFVNDKENYESTQPKSRRRSSSESHRRQTEPSVILQYKKPEDNFSRKNVFKTTKK